MRVLVTVGSTDFDPLVLTVIWQPVLVNLIARGYDKVIIQCGNSAVDFGRPVESGLSFRKDGMDIEVWKFKPTLQEEYSRADLVISHAGSGTILDVLRLGKPLIVIPNPTLLDNHQEELANALSALGHLKASTILDLPETISDLHTSSLTPFPAPDESNFQALLDEEMGFM
ncbi:glycosyltransferase family 1 protein [Jaapia argillacea MUCL 33604]|uniref:UDP-N-acetylglucosamine transferase subunit ALG13 n=1 Tax=Jaapia argillacea MUCL 33604 TaxID=933084 RepID=A0A067QDS8_9AGAM|nr:glycosyltransferase family 1 protein [Jaapia argillacea MUCL 33604]